MAQRILIVDDEPNVRQMVADTFTRQGLEVLEAADYEEATAVLGQDPLPGLVVIDFLLPRKNGFALAEWIRKTERTSHLPLVMLSGVFKNPKTAVEAREKFQVLDFLSKPIDLDRLQTLVRGAVGAGRPGSGRGGAKAAPAQGAGASVTGLKVAPYGGRPFPVLPESGSIEQYPVALLISIAHYDRITGTIDLKSDDALRRVYVRDGQPIFMQSNADGENVGALLLRRGRINEMDYERCNQYIKTKKRTLQQALLELKLATEADLATAYKLLAGQLLPSTCGMTDGTFVFKETDAFVGRVPEGNIESFSVLFEGIKRCVNPPQVVKFFKGREDMALKPTTLFEELQPFFRRAFGATNVAARIDGSATYRALIKGSPDAGAQLYALVVSGMVMLPELAGGAGSVETPAETFRPTRRVDVTEDGFSRAGSEETPTPAVAEEDAGPIDFTAEEQKAREKIEAGYDRLMSKDYFGLFGVPRQADLDLDKLKEVYFKMVKDWHADAYARLRIGDAKEKRDAVFHHITEAYETLTDPTKLANYLILITRQEKGLPTDVESVFKAENVFDEGLVLLRKHEYAKAVAEFKRATEINPGQAIFWAHLGWASFLANPNDVATATKHLKKAVTDQENLAIGYQFLGQIGFQTGKLGEAKKHFTMCLQHEPRNVEAARCLRLINQRADKNDKSKSTGLLSRFLSKK